MLVYNDILESEYVYIGEDEEYHVRDDAPEDIKKRFYDFFAEIETVEDGIVSHR